MLVYHGISLLVECGAPQCTIQACSLYEVKWILCDGCSVWLHKYCVGLGENDDPSEYFCELCQHNDVAGKEDTSI